MITRVVSRCLNTESHSCAALTRVVGRCSHVQSSGIVGGYSVAEWVFGMTMKPLALGVWTRLAHSGGDPTGSQWW